MPMKTKTWLIVTANNEQDHVNAETAAEALQVYYTLMFSISVLMNIPFSLKIRAIVPIWSYSRS